MSNHDQQTGNASPAQQGGGEDRDSRAGKGTLTEGLGSPAVGRALSESGGSPLPGAVRSGVEGLTGGDLSGVRVHASPAAGEASAALGARAFTMGSGIYLGAGESASDQHLMAHEATHAVQQSGGDAAAQRKAVGVVAESDPAEQQADRVADAVTTGGAAPGPITAVGAGMIARKPVNETVTPKAGERDPVSPATVAPPADEIKLDGEGNQIKRAGSIWYLANEPKHVGFPHAKGDYQLYPINPNASFAALRAAVVKAQAHQLATANALKPDMKYWFAKVYYFVTTHELAAIDGGVYQYPHMKMQEVLSFNETYSQNLEAWKKGNKAQVEGQWKAAFAAAESENSGTWYRSKMFEIVHALLPSMQAHIRFDLPRAIAACYQTHYAGIPGASLASFKPDFEAMAPVFAAAQADLRPEIGDETWFGGNATLQDIGMAFEFNVDEQRKMTWQKTDALVKAQNRGANVDKAIHSTINTAHPNSGSDSFEVDGDEIEDFDWTHQPGMKKDAAGPKPVYDPVPATPKFPDQLFFKQGHPLEGEPLEKAIRDDQNLAPFKDLAWWTDNVRGAQLTLEGFASVEGEKVDNLSLASQRSTALQVFMYRAGSDPLNNRIDAIGSGIHGKAADAKDRFVKITLDTSKATSKQQSTPDNKNLPSEVNGKSK